MRIPHVVLHLLQLLRSAPQNALHFRHVRCTTDEVQRTRYNVRVYLQIQFMFFEILCNSGQTFAQMFCLNFVFLLFHNLILPFGRSH